MSARSVATRQRLVGDRLDEAFARGKERNPGGDREADDQGENPLVQTGGSRRRPWNEDRLGESKPHSDPPGPPGSTRYVPEDTVLLPPLEGSPQTAYPLPMRERKVVTVLFADLVGFTATAEQLDPEDVADILRPYHERLRYELERWGGTVEKFIGDAVMALFGAPVTREDDPERAVRAALAIRDWIAEEGKLEVRIAVNTGEALVDLDARPESGEGMAAGDVVNTAARMQTAAPVNGILVGETTYRATAQAIDYREHEPVEAKGKAGADPVWEVAAARARFGVDVAPQQRTPLVGREREVAQVVDALARVREQRSSELVTLVGVPGIGKSRLVGELFQSIEYGGELTYWRQGRSLPYGQGVSFWALAEMVKAQAGILETRQRRGGGRKACAHGRAAPRRGQGVGAVASASARRAGERRGGLAGGGVRRVAPLLRGPRGGARRSCSCSRTSTGPTTGCSTSSTTSRTGCATCRSCRLYGPTGAARAAAGMGRRQGERLNGAARAALGRADGAS